MTFSKNRALRSAIGSLVAGSAMALASGTASAISVTDLGRVKNQPSVIELSATAPTYAFDGWNGVCPNAGWAHNSKWYTITVPTKTPVQITMTSGDPNMKPAFVLFMTTGDFNGADHLYHCYNQAGLGGESEFLKPQTPGGNGATKWIGYANAGDAFTNYDGRNIGKGTGPITAVTPGEAAALSTTLEAGQYLMAVGGSCNSQSCGAPTQLPFSLSVQRAPILPPPVE